MFNNVSSELYFIYGIVLFLLILISIIVIIDKKDNKKHKRRIKLTDTLNMKPITEETLIDNKCEVEVIESIEDELSNTKELPEIKSNLEKMGLIEKEEEYIETDLEKTQAQIRVEEINQALLDANIDEEIEAKKDKYAFYEEEQEKNAIISYEQLKDSYDRLYEESEKIQYIDDNNIPINIKELYELSEREQEELLTI